MDNKANAANVSQGKPKVGGAAFRAEVGTELPTSATAALNAKFVNQGYISEDGLTNTMESDSSEVKAWGGDIVLRSTTGNNDKFKFTLVETLSESVQKTVYGDKNVTKETGGDLKVSVNGNDKGYSSWIFDAILKGGRLRRIVVPKALIESIGDIVYKDGELIGYEVTIATEPDDSGNTHYEYTTASAPTEAEA